MVTPLIVSSNLHSSRFSQLTVSEILSEKSQKQEIHKYSTIAIVYCYSCFFLMLVIITNSLCLTW